MLRKKNEKMQRERETVEVERKKVKKNEEINRVEGNIHSFPTKSTTTNKLTKKKRKRSPTFASAIYYIYFLFRSLLWLFILSLFTYFFFLSMSRWKMLDWIRKIGPFIILSALVLSSAHIYLSSYLLPDRMPSSQYDSYINVSLDVAHGTTMTVCSTTTTAAAARCASLALSSGDAALIHRKEMAK